MNNYIIKVTEECEQSLKNIIKYLNLNIVDDFYQSLLQKLKLLEIFPRMYPKYKGKDEIRKFKVKKYIVLYKIENNIIYIIDIIHQKSKLLNNQY